MSKRDELRGLTREQLIRKAMASETAADRFREELRAAAREREEIRKRLEQFQRKIKPRRMIFYLVEFASSLNMRLIDIGEIPRGQPMWSAWAVLDWATACVQRAEEQVEQDKETEA